MQRLQLSGEVLRLQQVVREPGGDMNLYGVEFSAAHAVARLRSRMKTFMAASSSGVSDIVRCFMGSRMLR